MKRILILTSALLVFGAFAGNFESPEQAAKFKLDINCGGNGILTYVDKADEGYDYAVYAVVMSNGSATVLATSDISYDGNFNNDVAYEVTDYICNN